MLSSCVLLLIVIICIVSNYAFVLPKKDKILFQLYKCRDDLTIYAMNMPGKQNTEEYKYLIGMINVEIYLMKNNFSFSDFYRTTVKKTVAGEKEVERIITKIEKDEYMKKIHEESFGVFFEYFNKKFKIFNIIILKPFIFVLEGIERVLKLITEDNTIKVIGVFNRIFVAIASIPRIYEQYMRVNKAI